MLREATPDTVSTLTLDQVKQYHDATIRPDLTTIVVIGDVTPADARSVVEKWFGDWKATGEKPNTTLPAIPVNKASAATVPDSEAVQDSVTLAEQIDINRFDPDYYPLQLGNHVLGGGFYATRLYHDLRQVAGYVYNVDVGMSTSKTRADYSVTYGCDPPNVSKAKALIVRDLNQMRTQNVSDAELHQAKALLLRSIPLSESSEEAVAGGLLGRAEIGLPLDEPIVAAKKYSALTADDVKAAFAKHIQPDNLVQIVRGPAPAVSWATRFLCGRNGGVATGTKPGPATGFRRCGGGSTGSGPGTAARRGARGRESAGRRAGIPLPCSVDKPSWLHHTSLVARCPQSHGRATPGAPVPVYF